MKTDDGPASWGPVELVGVIAGPVFFVFVILIIVVSIFHHHQRVYHNRQRLDMEDPSCEMCLSKDKTLQDLVYDLSTSGSGSGMEVFLFAQRVKFLVLLWFEAWFYISMYKNAVHAISVAYIEGRPILFQLPILFYRNEILESYSFLRTGLNNSCMSQLASFSVTKLIVSQQE